MTSPGEGRQRANGSASIAGIWESGDPKDSGLRLQRVNHHWHRCRWADTCRKPCEHVEMWAVPFAVFPSSCSGSACWCCWRPGCCTSRQVQVQWPKGVYQQLQSAVTLCFSCTALIDEILCCTSRGGGSSLLSKNCRHCFNQRCFAAGDG